MPTGYTYKVGKKEITEFKDFALLCARAMGACVSIKDDPLSKEIPQEFKPSYYNKEQVQEAENRKKWLISLTKKQLIIESEKEQYDNIRDKKEYNLNLKKENDLYNLMLEKVHKWNPPTLDHMGFKEFMVNQLTISMNNIWLENIVLLSPEEWLTKQLNACQKDIEYHSKAQEEENIRVNKRNEWIHKLRESLK